MSTGPVFLSSFSPSCSWTAVKRFGYSLGSLAAPIPGAGVAPPPPGGGGGGRGRFPKGPRPALRGNLEGVSVESGQPGLIHDHRTQRIAQHVDEPRNRLHSGDNPRDP